MLNTGGLSEKLLAIDQVPDRFERVEPNALRIVFVLSFKYSPDTMGPKLGIKKSQLFPFLQYFIRYL